MNKTSKLIVGRWFLALLIGGGAVSAAFGQGTLSASATLTAAQSGSMYNYTLTLNNTGTLPITTFWYAWVPGGFFLPDAPSSPTVTSVPASWWASSVISTAGVGITSYTAYSVRWEANASYWAVSPGSHVSFGFTSPDSPATLAGNVATGTSNPYGGTAIGTSYIYENTFSSATQTPAYEFVVQSVPEPSALALLAVGFLSLASVWRWKLRRRGTYIT